MDDNYKKITCRYSNSIEEASLNLRTKVGMKVILLLIEMQIDFYCIVLFIYFSPRFSCIYKQYPLNNISPPLASTADNTKQPS